MDLIGDTDHMILLAKLCDPDQCLFVPDLAHRIVRIAEDHDGCLRVCQLLLQIIETDMITELILVVYQRTLQNPASVVADRAEKDVIDR